MSTTLARVLGLETLGRTWPDRREIAERRKVLDTRTAVDIDPTSQWLGDLDRRQGERRFSARPVAITGWTLL